MTSVFKITVLLTLTIFILIVKESECRPGSYSSSMDPWGHYRCEYESDDVIEVCQRCAKRTKSDIVYPMCCSNEDDVFSWCHQYINYGKQP